MMIKWILGRFSPTILAYASVGLLTAFTLSTVSLGFMSKAYVNAKAEIETVRGKCETDKAVAIAEAERITRTAVQDAAKARERQLLAQIERESTATENEREKRLQAERRIAARDRELRELAEEAFDEDDLPDSNAVLNVYLTSCALRSVLHAGDNPATDTGALRGNEVCADARSPNGMHPGFSNVTFGDALRYWGQDRDTVKRLNGKLAEIRRIQGQVIDEQD